MVIRKPKAWTSVIIIIEGVLKRIVGGSEEDAVRPARDSALSVRLSCPFIRWPEMNGALHKAVEGCTRLPLLQQFIAGQQSSHTIFPQQTFANAASRRPDAIVEIAKPEFIDIMFGSAQRILHRVKIGVPCSDTALVAGEMRAYEPEA